LVIGKLVGISVASWLSIKAKLAEPPDGLGWMHLIGGAAVAGIGFTVSLFITTLAFEEAALVDAAKIGVLIGSTVAGLIGAGILWRAPRPLVGSRGGEK
jgi:NhaA family Na+:H+ antiporter